MVLCKFFQQGYCRYGQSCRFEHEYGSKYSYRAPQTQRNENVSANASSLFRSAVQQSTNVYNNTSNSVFAPIPQSRPSVFDRLGQSNNPAKSIFAQANRNVPNQAATIFSQSNRGSTFDQPNSASTFWQSNSASTFSQSNSELTFGQSNSGLTFGQSNSGSTFGQSNLGSTFGQSNPFQTNQSSAANIFASAAQRLPTQNTPPNVFQISDKPSNSFGVSSTYEISNDNGIYSTLEDLTRSDLEAFESPDFKLGFIPEVPPPRSLCV